MLATHSPLADNLLATNTFLPGLLIQILHNMQRMPKCLVADDALQRAYQTMADKFQDSGIDVESIEAARVYFTGLDHVGHSQEAKLYSNLGSGSLPKNAVRILVLPLADSQQMSSAGAALAPASALCWPINF